MLDPITISAGIATAKAVISGAKSAFEMAKSAMDEIREVAEQAQGAGASASDAMGQLSKFFNAQAKVEQAVAEAQERKINPPLDEAGNPVHEVDGRSDTEIALEAMMMARQMKQMEDEIKHYLIYSFNEPGLYDELCQRRDAIKAERDAKKEAERKAKLEAILEKKRQEMAKRRERERRIQFAADSITVILGAGVSAATIYGIWWMFHYKG